ncbi:MAG: M23 family metallopeptidase, partial [Salinisphaera sp.]|uniref:M23 family metallopeptidase n=1 Tax=Salinisphaera sp. TaxID=1914330 RepID=UPI003C7ACD87
AKPLPAGDPTPSARPRRRRTLLLALLLVALIGLLAARPDLRRPAVRTAADAAHGLVFDTLDISPRQVYAERLWIAGLYNTPLGQRWRHAADNTAPEVFHHRLSSAVDFSAERIAARVYATDLKRGMALEWRLARPDAASGRLYATLERRDGTAWDHVATLKADARAHRYVADENGRYRLVLQPELAASVHARLTLARGGSLPFPVVGGHQYDIGGGFGASRDGGARKHKGVDIFADRDTPVRAVVAGRVSTGSGGLGGHYIFLSSGLTGPRFYYAHLDHFAVDSGAHVDKKQVIGYVGNSGNAAGGPTHLHFGVYTSGGAIDPAPFIKPLPDLPSG